jgi:hypothetical protein
VSRPKKHRLPKGSKRPRHLHRKPTSPEIRRWVAEEAIPPQPGWMSDQVYAELAKWRLEL